MKDMNSLLYNRYSSSQNYYYTKDINEIFSAERTPVFIKYKDMLIFDEEEELLKRRYFSHELFNKLCLFTEYYKFH